MSLLKKERAGVALETPTALSYSKKEKPNLLNSALDTALLGRKENGLQ